MEVAQLSQSLRLLSPPPALCPARTPPTDARRLQRETSVPDGIGRKAGHGWRGTRHRTNTGTPLSRKEALGPKARLSLAAWYPLPHTPVRDTTRLELLVPLADNDGVPFSDSAFASFEDFLVDTAGGFTRRGDVERAWRAPDGQVMRDRSRSYVVPVPEHLTDRVASAIDHYVRRQFRQQAAFVETLPARAVAF